MLRKFVSAFLIFSLCVVSFFIYPISVSASEKGNTWNIGNKIMAVTTSTVNGPVSSLNGKWSATDNWNSMLGSVSGVFQNGGSSNFFTVGHVYTVSFTYYCNAVRYGTAQATLSGYELNSSGSRIICPDNSTSVSLPYTTTSRYVSFTYKATTVSDVFRFSLQYSCKATVNSSAYNTNQTVYSTCSVFVSDFKVIDATEDVISPDDKDHLGNIDKNTEEQNKKLDDMMNGYDPSSGNNINDQLSNGLNEFDKVQGDLFNTAVDGMKDFKPGDVSMDVLDGNLLSGVWFVTTLLQAVYLSSGGLVGFGVIASVAFAVAFSAMVVGLYRYYIK